MLRDGTKDLELWLQVFAQIHDGCHITTAVAIVRCRPHRNDILILEVILQQVSSYELVIKELLTLYPSLTN